MVHFNLKAAPARRSAAVIIAQPRDATGNPWERLVLHSGDFDDAAPRAHAGPADALAIRLDAAADPARVETAPLDALPYAWNAAWDDLAARAAMPNSYAERWFVEASVRNLALPRDARMHSVWRGSELIGLMPIASAGRYGRIPVRHAQNWRHHHNFLGTPLVRAGAETAFWDALLAALDADAALPGFLHITALVADGPVHRGLQAVRPSPVVHRTIRALLSSGLSPDEYYRTHTRKKKRQELERRLRRLAELGTLAHRRLGPADAVDGWCDDFLALEESGWKGRAGSALGRDPGTAAFFREALRGAHGLGKLHFLRIDLDGKPIAMLIAFLAPPGALSFKIAFDEDYAAYSPGVQIQIDNLRILARGDVAWMDSCSAEGCAMINSLWAERREIVRVTVPLAGRRRRALFNLCRAAEQAAHALRGARRAAAAPIAAMGGR
jgi:CelD/BcsL family acetyltransferase involved in cellulose biosynthesis